MLVSLLIVVFRIKFHIILDSIAGKLSTPKGNQIQYKTYLMETNIIANIKYFPNKGTTSDVGGIISTTSKKNTWRLIKIDIDNVTCK